MYHPTLEQVMGLVGQGNLVPIYREIDADLETPVSAYLKVARPPYSFLLESVEGGERLARYSFIGTEPYTVLNTGTGPHDRIDPLIPIKAEMDKYQFIPMPDLPRFHGGGVGYLAYDIIRYFEPRVPEPPQDTLGLPEARFMFNDTLLVFDHLRHTIKVVSHIHLKDDVESSYREATEKIDRLADRLSMPLEMPEYMRASGSTTVIPHPVTSNFTQEDYEAAVEKSQEYIVAGDIIQVVPSQRLARRTEAHPFQIYRSLRSINPSPYMYYLHLDDFHIVGASIENVVGIEAGTASAHPIAGTRPRGGTPEEDAALEKELRESEKQRAEHIMLVDLARNDIGRVCEAGTVHVPDLMYVERYSRVMHLVSHVEGKMRPDLDAYDAVRACFPAGTVSGAPKIRAMEIISELEGQKRGPYGGAVGYFSYSGNMDTALTLRTAVIKDGVAFIQAGGGVVYDSTPEDEYHETLHKAGALLRAIDKAEGLE